MDCIHPIKILNPTKYLSLKYSDRYVVYGRCGKCFACQETLQKEWYFRTYVEFMATIQNGFVLFDCLTYRPKDVPRVSGFLDIPKSLDFMCFDYHQVTDFLKLLRIRLERKGIDVDSNIRYFVSSEYGTDDTKTHRPHYHLLLFVRNNVVEPLYLSRMVSKCWKYGRTDGLPYKSCAYVQYNTINGGLAQSIRVCKYVSKYVNKSYEFQKVVNSRIDKIVHYLFRQQNKEQDFEKWSKSEVGKKYKRDIIRNLNQFHRQSLGFGLSYLEDCDLNEIMDTNIISIPDNNSSLVMRIGLPLYYKRKLFYELVEVNGIKCWQPTEYGLQYLSRRNYDKVKQLIGRYEVARFCGVKIRDIELLANYVVYKRGRIKGDIDTDSIIEVRLGAVPLLYNYVTSSDKMQFNSRFISTKYLGNKNGYNLSSLSFAEFMSPNEFIKEFVYYDADFETELQKVDEMSKEIDEKMQQLAVI